MGLSQRFGWSLPQIFGAIVLGVATGMYIWLPLRDEYRKIHDEERLRRIQERKAEAEKSD